MSYPNYLDDMEPQLASYLGEDSSTFSSNENPTASAAVDSLEETPYDANGQFTWEDFLREEGLEMNSPHPTTLEWNPRQAEFYGDEDVAPLTVDEPSSEEPTQSSRQKEEAPINIASDSTNEQPIATPSEPMSQPEENTNIPEDVSIFVEGKTDENTGDNSNVQSVAADFQPSNSLELEQEENIDNDDNDSLFGGSTSNDVEAPNFDEEHQSEAMAQEANSTPEFVADTLHNADSAASAPITPDADLNGVNADNDNDSLFGDVDNSGVGDSFQPPENQSLTGDNAPLEAPTDNVDDLFGPAFGDDFEAELAAELEVELRRDSTNAMAPVVPTHTRLHLPKPPRKMARSQGLYLPDPPRAIANPQGLHLPAPPQMLVAPQGLHLPDPPRVVASSQGLNLPVPPRMVAGPQGLHLPSLPPAIGSQQSEVATSAPVQTGNQEVEAPNSRRRVRASRIPRSDMSRPKGRGQAGKIMTQLSGPAPSKLPEPVPSSSSRADDTAEKVTRLPRWAFGKYTTFSKPVAGGKYREPNNSVQNPTPGEDEPESVDKTNENNSGNQNIVQPASSIPDAIDLTSDTQEPLAMEGTVQGNPAVNHNSGQGSTRPHEDFQIPAFGSEMALTYDNDQFQTFPDELSFPTFMDDADPAPQLQSYQSHNSATLDIVAPVAPQCEVLSPPIMENFSPYGQAPLADSYNSHPVKVANVHGTDPFLDPSPYAMEQIAAQSYQPAMQPMQTGNFEQGSGYAIGNDIAQNTSGNVGGNNSSAMNNSRPKKRLSHERAEYGDPRVLMTYDEFKQVFPQEQTRGCFETAIQNERAADATLVARGGVPPQRPTIRKSIICTWSQVQHLNRIRAANGEKLFEPKPNAHKRPEAFKESLRRKRQERGEISESEESDMEPEAKRLRLAQEPIQMEPSSGEQNGERSSEIRSIQPDNPQVSVNASRPPPNHGIPRSPHTQNVDQVSSMQIHQPVPQSFKRKMGPEQLESFESMGQEVRPTAKRPRIAAPSSQTSRPIINQPVAKDFKDYISERQSEYLKLRVPELRQLCKTRDVKHGNINNLSKGGLVGVLVGQDVSRHPVHRQVHNQAQAGLRAQRGHPISNVVGMGRMNPPSVAANRSQQQPKVPNGWGTRQNLPASNVGPDYGMGSNHHQRASSQFHNTGSNRAPGSAPMRFGNSALPVTNSGLNRGPSHGSSWPVNVARVQQLHMNGNPSGLAKNGGQPLTSTRDQSNMSQGYQGSTMHPSPANPYAQSRLPVSVHHNGYSNGGIQPNLNGSRNNHHSANTQVPAYVIDGDFGAGIYQPAVDDRRRKPRIAGQDVPSRAPRGNKRSLPQPAMNNTARPATRANIGGDPRRLMQNRPQSGLYPAPRQGLSQGARQLHAVAPGLPQFHFGRRPANPFSG
ncbi:uncharacterized protein EAF01_008972 [Botrytis porri]|uniref:uncharacterized protein n=1 Tax=Botrytis porri TaxID=87229 RepID=UPI0019019AEE|nr:uncharacterized protein EAF01_008972 [Botrytis porri]KAF7898006.1 hypothetical protein EAF01_008972 [Botrytis porri]